MKMIIKIFNDMKITNSLTFLCALAAAATVGAAIFAIPAASAAPLAVEEFYPIDEIEKGIMKEVTSELMLDRSRFDDPGVAFDDDPPAGAAEVLPFKYDSSKPFSGRKCVALEESGKQISYYITHSSDFALGQADNVVFYMLVPGGRRPGTVVVAFYDEEGSFEHRARFGGTSLDFGGEPGTFSDFEAGPLPQTGDAWHRIVIPAVDLGLSGKKVRGILVAKDGGAVRFDKFTKSAAINDPQKSTVLPVENILTVFKNSFVHLSLNPGGAAPSSEAVVAVAYAGGKKFSRKLVANERGVFVFNLLDDSGAVLPSGDAEITLEYKDASGAKKTSSTSYRILQMIAGIYVPWRNSIVNATVPVFGDAVGVDFQKYVVTIQSLSGNEKPVVLAESKEPRFLVNHRIKFPGKATVSGNIFSFDVGTNFGYKYARKSVRDGKTGIKYNGRYRLALTVFDRAGNFRSDTCDVIVGRIISNSTGLFVESDDGKAALFAEPYSIEEGFVLASLLAADPSLPSGSPVAKNGNLKLVSPIYEARPRGLAFDVPATLKLAPNVSGMATETVAVFRYSQDEGWLMLDTALDADELSARVNGFSKKGRTYFAAWSGDLAPFRGDPKKMDAVKKFEVSAPPFAVECQSHPFFAQCDFENGNTEMAPRSSTGNAAIAIDETTRATGKRSLKITCLSKPSDVSVYLTTKRYDARRFPILSFDYRCPATFEVNIMIKAAGRYFEVPLSHRTSGSSIGHVTVGCQPIIRDGLWHRFSANVYEMIKNVAGDLPDGAPVEIEEIFFCDYRYVGWAEVSDGFNEVGSSMNVDNLCIFSGGSSEKTVKFSWKPLDKNITKFIYSFDGVAGNVPRAEPSDATSAEFKVTADGGADEWYLHITGVSADGSSRTGTSHVAVKVDNTPPAVTETSPRDGESASNATITARIDDGSGSGVRPDSIKCTVDGTLFKVGDGALTYDSTTRQMRLEFFKKRPSPPGFIDGQSVRVAIDGVGDNAGNVMAKPYEFTFNIDYSSMTAGRDILLTSDGGESPSWSPDGKRIAYTCFKNGKSSVMVTSVAERKPAALSKDPSADYADPCFAPDGSVVASKRPVGSQSFSLVVIPADGSAERALTSGPDANDVTPCVSPDGKTVVFSRNNDICCVPFAGGEVRRLLGDVNGFFLEPSFSPDGRTIIFRKDLYINTIWACGADGNDPRIVIPDGTEFRPSFSPDGAKILFTRRDEKSSSIYTANPDGSEISQILKGDLFLSQNPRMSPDGQFIAYESTRNGMWNISVFSLVYSPKVETAAQEAAAPAAPGEEKPAEAGIKISYDVPQDGTQVTVKIFDSQNKLVKTLSASRKELRGKSSVRWDRTTDGGGGMNPDAPYIVSFEFKTPDSGKAVTKVSKIALTEKAKAEKVDFGKLRGEIQRAEDERRKSETAAIDRARESMVKGKDSEPPAPVADFEARPLVGKIALRWKAGSEPDLAGYNVARMRHGDRSDRFVRNLPASATSFTDENAESGVKFAYAISAVDSSGNESAVREISATSEFDFVRFAFETKDGVRAVKFNMNNLEFDVMKDGGADFSSSLLAPPNLGDASRFSFASCAGYYTVFCFDQNSGDLFFTKSYNLRSFSAWKMASGSFDLPDGAGAQSSLVFATPSDDAPITGLCYDPESEKLWLIEINRKNQRVRTRSLPSSFMEPPSGTRVCSLAIAGGKYSVFATDAAGKSSYKCATSDFKAWTSWKKQ